MRTANSFGQNIVNRVWGRAPLVATTALAGALMATFGAHGAQAQSTGTGTGTATADAATTLTEVVVTAQKREENVQKVPEALTVVGQRQIQQQNITDLGGLARAVPALTVQPGPGGTYSIRGLGTSTFSRSAESSVTPVLDGVSLAGSENGQNPSSLFDVQRVEVLEGPQGMLFGKNASAGVINIVTNAPDPNKFEAIGHVDIGTHDDQIVQGVVNLPLGSDAALRVSGHYTDNGQYIYNAFKNKWDTDYSEGARARLLWTPSDRLTVNLIADYDTGTQKEDIWTVINSTPGSYLTAGLATCGITASRGNNRFCTNGPNSGFDHHYGASAQVDYKFGGYVLTSISAVRVAQQGGQGGDADSVPTDVLDINTGPNLTDIFSQELRITSPADQFVSFVAGLFYFQNNSNFTGAQAGTLNIVPFPLLLGQDFRTVANSKSYAAFGQATIHVSDTFRLIAGGRLTEDQIDAHTRRTVPATVVAPFGSVSPIDGSARVSNFSWRLGGEFDISSTAMLYATATTGYKGPAINDQAPDTTIPIVVKSETSTNLEAGAKTRLFENRLALNLSVFHDQITNFQTQTYDSTTASFIFGNAPSLTTQGVELQAFGRLTPAFSLNGGLIYDDAHYGGGYLVPCGPTQTLAQGCTAVGTTNASGHVLTGSPKWKANVSGEYDHDIGGLGGFVQADLSYQSSVTYNAAYDPGADYHGYATVDARIGVRGSGNHWSASVFVRNLTDERHPGYIIDTPLAALEGDPASHSQFLSLDSFRVIGISLDARM